MAMPEDSLTIFLGDNLWVSPTEWNKQKSAVFSFTWDPSRTTIEVAKVRGRVKTDAGWPGVTFKLFFNGDKMVDIPLASGDGWKSYEATVLPRNGRNEVTVFTDRVAGWGWSYNIWFDLEFTYQYTGDPPMAGPPTKPFPWQEYVKNAILGAFILAPVATGYAVFVEKLDMTTALRKWGLTGLMVGALAGAAITFVTVGIGEEFSARMYKQALASRV